MGEAKFRKQNDIHFGKVPHSIKKRGLIISNPLTISGTSISGGSNLDPQDLRFSLFFWDRLVWPEAGGIHFSGSQDEAFLESAGILERPNYHYNGDVSKTIIMGFVQALHDYNKKEPGVWALGGGTNSISHDKDLTIQNAGTLLTLQNCIPIPTEAVPIEEILQFRHKRRDQLINFRTHLELLVNEIEQSSDSEAALIQATTDIDKACAELARTAKEWQMPLTLINFKSSFNFDLSKAMSSATRVWIESQKLNLPITESVLASAVAGVASQINVSSDIKLRKFKKDSSPFKYAYSIEQYFNTR
ncbi:MULTISPECIES: DUF6236 family protein [Pseudomonas]|uniref:DUF6236 family protein n=1 Tax=Pseudomonas TaxID=286 RepID=UPI0018E6FC6F|nr:DUF6236 family protein [Pseudomonas haemolytica]MBJ2274787.1 hypothetical protein [Pseudomonas haemolytica]